MRKDTKTHLAYGAVLFIAILSVLFYHSYTLDLLRQDVLSQAAQLGQQITGVKNELTSVLASSVTTLENKDKSIEAELTNLGGSLQEKEKQIKSLSGELQQVKVQSAEEVSKLQSKIDALKVQNQDFSDIIDTVIKSVVSVQTNVGLGSGFIVDRSGYIVTNYHVIEGAQAGVILTSDGKSHAVRIVDSNKNADIAVLKINGTFPRLRFGDSDSARVGQKVIAVGNPGGLDFTVTQGIISAVNRKDSKGNNLIQIDVAINPGNSGGPLVDASGEVLGVTSVKLSGFEGVGFAITSKQVEGIVDGIIANDLSS